MTPRPSADAGDPAAEDRADARAAAARGGVLVCCLGAGLLLLDAAHRRVPAAPGHGVAAPDMRVVLDRDPLPVLDALPGVGPATAAALQAAARRHPPRIGRDLRAADGVGPSTAARLAPHVRLAPEPATAPAPAAP